MEAPKIGQWIATHGTNHGAGKVTNVNPETGAVTATFSPLFDPQGKLNEKTVTPAEIGDLITDPGLIRECEQSILS
ncbi:hypothetical protein HQ571_02260 [Candidatus Kuenenbacteria bacterium]|nr:hypothetical protein [Candidatus Kuenenbacteria bacterium]